MSRIDLDYVYDAVVRPPRKRRIKPTPATPRGGPPVKRQEDPDYTYVTISLIWAALVLVCGVLLLTAGLGCGGIAIERPVPSIDDERVVVEADDDALSLTAQAELSYWVASVRLMVIAFIDYPDEGQPLDGTLHQEALVRTLGRSLLLQTLDCKLGDGTCELCVCKPEGMPLLCVELGR